jgi:hypothetical protein
MRSRERANVFLALLDQIQRAFAFHSGPLDEGPRLRGLVFGIRVNHDGGSGQQAVRQN